MNLYHWKVSFRDEHGRDLVFNFLTMAEDQGSARRVLLQEVSVAPVSRANQNLLSTALLNAPTLVADALYPIVIW